MQGTIFSTSHEDSGSMRLAQELSDYGFSTSRHRAHRGSPKHVFQSGRDILLEI